MGILSLGSSSGDNQAENSLSLTSLRDANPTESDTGLGVWLRTIWIFLLFALALFGLGLLGGAVADVTDASATAEEPLTQAVTNETDSSVRDIQPVAATRQTDLSDSGERDTAVLWRGFRHAWSYNHRFNRFGSWVNMTDCDERNCEYTVGHSGASGSGPDVATTRDAYTELSAQNVGFASDATTISLNGPEKKPGPQSQAFDSTQRVEIDLQEHPELRNKDNYTALLNGFDVKSQGTAAKLIDFNLTATDVSRQNGKLVFDIDYDILMDCDSFECAGHVPDPTTFSVENYTGLSFNLETRTGKAVQTIDYEVDVRYLVIGGNESALNVVPGNRMGDEYSWDNCRNNGFPGGPNSDEFNLTPGPLSDNGFPGNHMWCENSEDREISYTDHWERTTLSGKDSQSGFGSNRRDPGYSVGVVGMKSLSVNMSHEAHFVQYDSIVGGSYDQTTGEYDVRALPFFKEWSSRPGMFQKARLSYGFEGEAEVELQPTLIQIRDGCKRSFVSADKIKWKGGGAIPTTDEAVSSSDYRFGFGEMWHGYHADRGNLCDWPSQPDSSATQTGRAVDDLDVDKMSDVFPLRDGYPQGIADRGDHIDLWDEVDSITNSEESDVQDPTQLRGRPSDRLNRSQSSPLPVADLSELNVTVRSRNGPTVVATEQIDLSGQQASGRDTVLLKEPAVYIEPGVRRGKLSVKNPEDEYEMKTYFHVGGGGEDGALGNRTEDLQASELAFSNDFLDYDYALEIVLSCRDGSCQTAHAMVPFTSPTGLDPVSPDDYHNITEVKGDSPGSDTDFYEFELEDFERVSHVGIENGSGLQLTLKERDGPELGTVPNGGSLETGTTTTDGDYYLRVDGDGVTNEYTLNLTIQRISQLYEENDRKSNAHNFFDSKPPMVELEPVHGSRTWCETSVSLPGDGNQSSTGGSVGGGGSGTSSTTGGECPRHDWNRRVQPQPGYSLDDPDWYEIKMQNGTKLDVNLSNENLGAEIHHDGNVQKETSPSAAEPTLLYLAEENSTFYLNVTGSDYVPSHDLDIQKVFPEGVDRFELNDKQVTATPLSPGTGTNVNNSDLLTLGGRDEDYYAVSLNSGDRLNATIDYRNSSGDINLSLVSPSGDVTQATNRSGQVQYRQQRAQKTTQESGRHYVRVSGTTSTAIVYNMSIRTEKSSSVDTGLLTEEIIEALEISAWNSIGAPTPEEIYKINNIAFEQIDIRPVGTPGDPPPDGPRFEVAIRQGDRVPDGVPSIEEALDAEAAGYLQVRHDEALEGAVQVQGRVNPELLAEYEATPEDIVMLRHPGPGAEGNWQAIETSYTETETGAIQVMGVSEQLSVYAIAIAPDGEIDDDEPTDEDETTDESTEETETTASEVGPGFGVVATLVALLAVLLIASRRVNR